MFRLAWGFFSFSLSFLSCLPAWLTLLLFITFLDDSWHTFTHSLIWSAVAVPLHLTRDPLRSTDFRSALISFQARQTWTPGPGPSASVTHHALFQMTVAVTTGGPAVAVSVNLMDGLKAVLVSQAKSR